MQDNIAAIKDTARKEASALRARFHTSTGPAQLEALSAHVLAALPKPSPGVIIAGYWPIGSELDTRLVLNDLARRGFALALPAVVAKGKPLAFRAWSPGDDLVDGQFNTKEPHPAAPVVTPDILLVPLLAFDKAGYRLGYGGGFYDRSIEGLRAAGNVTAFGLGYARQLVRAVPHDAHDQILDGIITECGLQSKLQAELPGN